MLQYRQIFINIWVSKERGFEDMNKCTKKCYYHDKDNKNATHLYITSDTLAQIKKDMFANNCVLDAIYYDDTHITLYSNALTKSDIIANQ